MIKVLPLLIILFFPALAKCQNRIIDEYLLHSNETVQNKIVNKIFLKTTANKNTCFVGEPIIITTKYYTRVTTEAKVIHSPSYNGFSIIDLNASDTAIEKINGISYMCYTLQKVQAYAMQEGAIEIEPMQADITSWFLKEDFYKSHNISIDELKEFSPTKFPIDAIATYNTIIKGTPLVLTINPLPKNGKPENFKGATGVFDIETSLEKNNLPANEKNVFSVTIRGSGNIHLISTPALNWPKKTEVFETKEEERINNYAIPINGSKTFKFSFIANDTGIIEMPNVVFSYYNSSTHSYQSIMSKPLQITVTRSLENKKLDIDQQTVRQTWLSKIFGNRFIVVLTVALGILAGLFFWVKKDKKREVQSNMLKLQNLEILRIEQIANEELLKQNQNPLGQSMHFMLAKDYKEFYKTINKEYKNFIANYLSIVPNELSKKNIILNLDKKNIEATTQTQIFNVLDEIEGRLYMPSNTGTDMEQLYHSALQTVEELRKQI